MKKDDARIVYGRIQEATDISGYGFSHVCDGLEFLLADDRWRQTGDFKSINEFLRTIDLSPFRLGERRPELVRKIKAIHPEASNRALAEAIGVGETTVRRDATAPNGAPAQNTDTPKQDVIEASAPFGAPDPEAAEPEPPNSTFAKRKAGEDARKAILEAPADPDRGSRAPSAKERDMGGDAGAGGFGSS